MGTTKRERQKAGRQARLEAARVAQARARRFRNARNLVLLTIGIVAVAFLLSRALGDDDDNVSTATSTTVAGETTTSLGAPSEFVYGTAPCPAPDGSSPATLTFPDAPSLCIDPAMQYTATFATTEGAFTVELDTSRTPGTTNNFVFLSRYHYYDNTVLFRTDPSIGIIQGGSPHNNSANDEGPGYALPDEGGVFDFSDPAQPTGPFTYQAGDLVMARSSGPNGAGAQFFLGVNDAIANLDAQGTYVRFGGVTEGLEVLEAILALHQEDPTSGLGGAPSREVRIQSIEITETPAS